MKVNKSLSATRLHPVVGIKDIYRSFLKFDLNLGSTRFQYDGQDAEILYGDFLQNCRLKSHIVYRCSHYLSRISYTVGRWTKNTSSNACLEGDLINSLLGSVADEVASITLLVSESLISFGSMVDKDCDTASLALIQSRKRLLASPLFSSLRGDDGLSNNAAILFIRKFVDHYQDERIQKLVSIMRGKCHGIDRINAPPEENHLVHVTCAALIWHHGYHFEALALAEGHEREPTEEFLALWKSGQKMRFFLKEGDIQNGKNVEPNISGGDVSTNEVYMHPGIEEDRRRDIIKSCLSRATYLLSRPASLSRINGISGREKSSISERLWYLEFIYVFTK